MKQSKEKEQQKSRNQAQTGHQSTNYDQTQTRHRRTDNNNRQTQNLQHTKTVQYHQVPVDMMPHIVGREARNVVRMRNNYNVTIHYEPDGRTRITGNQQDIDNTIQDIESTIQRRRRDTGQYTGQQQPSISNNDTDRQMQRDRSRTPKQTGQTNDRRHSRSRSPITQRRSTSNHRGKEEGFDNRQRSSYRQPNTQ